MIFLKKLIHANARSAPYLANARKPVLSIAYWLSPLLFLAFHLFWQSKNVKILNHIGNIEVFY